MPRQFKPTKKLVQPARDLMPDRMFETRSDAWAAVGLSVDYSAKAVKRAQREAALLIPLFIAIVVLYDHRRSLFGPGREGAVAYSHSNYAHYLGKHGTLTTPLQIFVAIALIIIGWAIARDFGRFAGPTFLRRMDPATAGTVGFVVRALLVVVVAIVALSVAGASFKTLLVGGGFTAVILGLAAQQTLGNMFAGTVLLSARPFRVGDSVRLQGGPLAGQIDGTVSTLGLLYTTFATEDGPIMVPNSVVLSVAVLARGRRHVGKDDTR